MTITQPETGYLAGGNPYYEAAYLQAYIGSGGVWQRPISTEISPSSPSRRSRPRASAPLHGNQPPSAAAYRTRPEPARNPRPRWILPAIFAAVLVSMAAYAVTRVVAGIHAAAADVQGLHLDVPWPAVALVASVLLVRWAFRAGQYHRGWMHARGIRQSHWRSIRGRH